MIPLSCHVHMDVVSVCVCECVCVRSPPAELDSGEPVPPSNQRQLSSPLHFLVTVTTLGEQTWMKIKEQRKGPRSYD